MLYSSFDAICATYRPPQATEFNSGSDSPHVDSIEKSSQILHSDKDILIAPRSYGRGKASR